MMSGLCGESSYGVFQLKRYVSPPSALITFLRPPAPPRPPPPPPPPRPPPGARPSTHAAADVSLPAAPPASCTRGPAVGRMLTVCPAFSSYRDVLPSCDSQKMMFGLLTLTPV